MSGLQSAHWLEADWPAPTGVRALTTLRAGPGVSPAPFEKLNLGDRCGDSATNVAENRRRLLESLQLPSAPCWLQQVHGNQVVEVQAPAGPGWTAPCADASVSRDRQAVLAVLSADCLPVVLAAEDGSELAIAHAGWRGLAGGVIENTVGACRTSAKDLIAWLGPAIGIAHFEVGPEVRAAFVAADARAEHAFRPGREDRWHADLYELARQRLRRVGVSRIHGGGLDTWSDAQRFFSYRRDGAHSGRMATLVWRSKV